MPKIYRLREGSMQWQAQKSRAKMQIIGGGFGNGKTTTMCVKFLEIAKRYPGCNILLGRSTYPKLNDTLRKEFLKWTPNEWIKRRPTKDDNTLILKNGSTINFRYISQQGKAGEDGTTSSNLLSATYDAIGIDQMEDPEISYKDFTDLLGRLRGDTRCLDNDGTWPEDGPRMFMMTANPTRNWFYRKIIRPLHIYQQTGMKTADLIVDAETGNPIIDLFEGATYENKENLPKDFIATLENTYKGQMRSRYLEGKWDAYEGLVYPAFDYVKHVKKHDEMLRLLTETRFLGYEPTVLEGYDFGMSRPSCYLFSFVDQFGNVHIIDGFHNAEMPLKAQSLEIERIRRKYEHYCTPQNAIIADPAIFKRQSQGGQVVGRSVAAMFDEDYSIEMRKGTNDIINGITKVSAFLEIDPIHRDPYTGNWGSPRFFINEELEKVIDEFGDYYWKKDSNAETVDTPIDKNDHGMDAIKYMLSYQPTPAVAIPERHSMIPMTWNEREMRENKRRYRYG